MANTALNRTGVVRLTNKSGGALTQGAVVVVDTANASAFTTTTTSGFVNGFIGVVIEPNGIANNAAGLVAFGIYVPKLTLNTAATIGQFIKTHTVAGQGTPHSAPAVAGDFAIALTASATPEAILFGMPAGATGGGGDSTLTAAYGSRPAASNDGNLFLPSDGFVVERDTGSVYAPWGPLFPLTAPVDGDFAWINQGGATVVTTNGGIHLNAPLGAADNVRLRKKAAPSVPYTVTALIVPKLRYGQYFSVGLAWRQSSDGKIILFGIGDLNGGSHPGAFEVAKMNSATSWNSSYVQGQFIAVPPFVFLRLADDNTNRICSYSYDGQNFIEWHSVGRTDFMTADEVGFYAYLNNGTYPAGLTLLSWKQA